MPFSLSGNIPLIDEIALKKFQRNFGVILSKNQSTAHQYYMVKQILTRNRILLKVIENLSREDLLNFIFLLSQFGDVSCTDSPIGYKDFENIPFIIEWQKDHFTIPLEVMEVLGNEKLFKDQNYLFSLIPTLPVKEKKAWARWMGLDFPKSTERDLNYVLHSNCRILQKPHLGKSLLQEDQFYLEDIWDLGRSEILDWYYKGLAPFYYTMEEASRREKDPFLLHIIDIIKAGKYFPKKVDEFGSHKKHLLVATVEGSTPQFRENQFFWEEKNIESSPLFGLIN